MGLPGAAPEDMLQARRFAGELFDCVLARKDSKYCALASYYAASTALADEDLDRAEHYLNQLPGPAPDADLLRIALQERRGNHPEAKKLLQTSLYEALQKTFSCLSKLSDSAYTPDPAQALEFCRRHRQLAEIMDFPYAMSDGLFLEVHLRQGDTDLASDDFLRLAKLLSDPPKPWGGLLFDELGLKEEKTASVLASMRRYLASNLASDPDCKRLEGTPSYQEGLALLQR